MQKSKTMQVVVEGKLPVGVTSKDITFAVIGKIGTAAGQVTRSNTRVRRSAIVDGRPHDDLQHGIEAGARTGMIAVDEKTFAYLKGRKLAPQGEQWDDAVAYWQTLPSDEGAKYDKTIALKSKNRAASLVGNKSGQMVLPINGNVPDPAQEKTRAAKGPRARSNTWDSRRNAITKIKLDRVFIGRAPTGASKICARPRIWSKGKQVASNVNS